MKFHVEIAGQEQTVELRRGDDGWTCVVNGKPRTADVVEVAPPFDPSGNTALVGATLMFEILCVLAEAVAGRRNA